MDNEPEPEATPTDGAVDPVETPTATTDTPPPTAASPVECVICGRQILTGTCLYCGYQPHAA